MNINPKIFYQKRINLRLLFILFLIIFTQTSCKQPQKNKSIILASKGKIDSLDPAQANKLLAIQLISSLGDPLYSIDSQGNLEPRLAKGEPIISKDGLTISIPLKENVRFHDGTIFDSYAMAFSLKRFIKIGTLNYIIDGRIRTIETPSKFLIRLKLNRPSSSIKGLLTSINITPVSPSYYSQHETKFLNDNFIGTGPYKLSSYSPEKQVLVPFEDYWDGKANNYGITYISFNTSTSLFSAIKTGQVDVLLSNSIEDGQRLALHRLSKQGLLIESQGPATQIGYIAFRTNSNLLQNKLTREALKFSIDRELISKQVSYGLREPLRSLTPPLLGLKVNPPWPAYNPKLSSSLLKEAGFCNNKKLTIPLTFRSNVPADKLLALTWKEQINRDLSNCLNISLNGVESTTVYKQLGEGAYEAVILGWTGDYPDPYAFLSPLLDCKKIKEDFCEEGEAVIGGTFWANNKLQKALQNSEELLGQERLKELHKVEVLAANGAAILPIWLEKPRAWAQPNLSTPQFDGSGRLLLNKIYKKDE